MILEENFPHIILYQLAKSHCLIACTSWDTVKYMYWNYFLSSLWRHNSLELSLTIFINSIFYLAKKSKGKYKYLKNEESF